MKRFILAAMTWALPLFAGAQTFTEVRDIVCGDTSLVGSLGYPTWNPAQIVDLPTYGHAMLLGDFIEPNLLQYVAPPYFEGADTLVIACAHATQITCDTGIYVYNISCPDPISTVFANLVPCNDSVYINNLSGWWAPQVLQQAQHGHAEVILEPTDGAGLAYRPDTGFEGLDAVTVSLMGGTQTYLYLFQVYCDLTTGSRELQAETITVFPNPATNELFVQHAGFVKEWNVIDMSGATRPIAVQTAGDLLRLDLSDVPPGVYVLCGLTADTLLIKKIVVKK
ncbi:MAG: T9SS type A sorting domain-containing protein [Saprospiraceae bacterium]|nr:T9SS type A sorting domain-containing protein [Saprospiraceae bacterium]